MLIQCLNVLEVLFFFSPDSGHTLLVTGYDEDESSSCEDISYTGSKWGKTPLT